jgi:hypothetical protein
MAECTFDRLPSGSRSGIFLAVVLIAALAGTAGGFVGWLASESQPEPERPGTLLLTVVSPDFSVTINQSGVELHPADGTYNCSLITFTAIKLAVDDFDAVTAYMAANPGYYFGTDNITDAIGDDQLQSGMTIEIISNELFNLGGTPRIDSKLDGKNFTVDFGNYVVMFFFEIGIFLDSVTYDTYSFGFEENAAFIEAMADNKVNSAVWNDAIFLQGLDNTLSIKNMTIDTIDVTLSAVDVAFNGVDMRLPYSMVF